MRAEDALDELARVYVACGSPQLASETIAAASRLEGRCAEALTRESSRLFRRPVDPEVTLHVHGFLREHGCEPRGEAFRMGFEYLGTEFGYLSCEADGPVAELHGIMVHHPRGDEVFGCIRSVGAEAMLVGAMWHIHMCALFLSNRSSVELSGFLGELGCGSAFLGYGDWFSAVGLRRGRLDGPIGSLRAWAAVMGIFRGFPRVVAMNLERLGRSARVRRRESETPLNACFAKVEFDGRMTDQAIAEVGDCFSGMLGSGVLPPVSKGFLACVRFRRYSHVRISQGLESVAWYEGDFRTVLVNALSPGTFVHEYGHCLDHSLGWISERAGFREVYDTYRREVDGALPPGREDYYLQRREVFARCLEIRAMSRTGPCTLLNDVSGSQVHPMSPMMVGVVERFFDSLRGGQANRPNIHEDMTIHGSREQV